jgi:hypothetical protein
MKGARRNEVRYAGRVLVLIGIIIFGVLFLVQMTALALLYTTRFIPLVDRHFPITEQDIVCGAVASGFLWLSSVFFYLRLERLQVSHGIPRK